MEHLAFVIWMIGYPLASTWSDMISAKKRKIEGLELYSKETKAFGAIVDIAIWWYVGWLLYQTSQI